MKQQARDPEMHQTRKGQQWYFGMKLHIGVDGRLAAQRCQDGSFGNVSTATAFPVRSPGSAATCQPVPPPGTTTRDQQEHSSQVGLAAFANF